MAITARPLEQVWEDPGRSAALLATVDHKVIGIRYIVTALIFFVLGGFQALLLRTQLAIPENTFLSPELYNQLFTMHGTTMIFFFATPVLFGFGNYLIPLLIGARDMAFPRVNAFGYWVFLLSGLFMYTSFLLGSAPNGGWFNYVPLTGPQYDHGLNIDFYALGLLFLGISTTGGAINFIVTIFKMRAPGMSINRMPLFCWAILATSFAVVFAYPSLNVANIFLELDRKVGTHFYDSGAGGYPLLWQHLFWFFGHPDVYIILLPAVGIVSEIVQTFSQRPIVGYVYLALAATATAVISFGVWVHHMFAVGLPPLANNFFSAASLVITLPAGLQVFAWIATIWLGKPRFATPFLFVLGFLVLFVLGGVTGVMFALVPFDQQTTDSYFVVAHFHYVLIGGAVFPMFAGLYYWIPKMTGRMLDEHLGRWNFWVMFVGFNLAFFPMHISGLLGMPRRVYTYQAGLGWDLTNMLSTLGAFLFALGILLFVVNYAQSRQHGAPAGDDPWHGATLEWATSSPPPAYNFRRIPTVHSLAPLWQQDDVRQLVRPRGGQQDAQHNAPADADTGPDTPAERVEQEEQALTDPFARETLGTTLLDAQPESIIRVPPDSYVPLLTAIALAIGFSGALVADWSVVVLGAVLSIVAIAAWLWPGAEEQTV